MVGGTQLLHAVEQHRQVLFPRAAAGKDQQAAGVGNAQFGTHMWVAPGGVESGKVNAQRLHMDIAHAQAA
ncbi:hypothetical protein D3C75_1219320 [compost metagenome]